MRLAAISALSLALLAAAGPANAQSGERAIRDRIETIAAYSRAELTPELRREANILVAKLAALSAAQGHGPPAPLSDAASGLLIDDGFADVCGFAQAAFNGRNEPAWRFRPPAATQAAVLHGRETDAQLRAALSSGAYSAFFDFRGGFTLDPQGYGRLLRIEKTGSTAQPRMLVDYVDSTQHCHSLMMIEPAPDEGQRSKVDGIGNVACGGSVEIERYRGQLYFLLAQPFARIAEVQPQRINPLEPLCRFRLQLEVLQVARDCEPRICDVVARQAQAYLAMPDRLRAGEPVAPAQLLGPDIVWRDAPPEPGRSQAYRLDIDNDGIDEIYIRSRFGTHSRLDYRILVRRGRQMVEIDPELRFAGWQSIDDASASADPAETAFAADQNINFVQFASQTYVVAITHSQAGANVYRFTLFKAADGRVTRLGTLTVTTRAQAARSNF